MSTNYILWHFARSGAFRGSKKSKFNSLSQTFNRTVVHLGHLEYTLALDKSFLFVHFCLLTDFEKKMKYCAIVKREDCLLVWNNHFYHNIAAGTSLESRPERAHIWITPLRQSGPLHTAAFPSSQAAPHCQIYLLKSLFALYHPCNQDL